jgi:uncharacterized membrane protein YczE
LKNLTLRTFFFVLGTVINSCGIAVITKAALGTSPISSVPYVLSLAFTPTFGQITFVLNMFFILGQIVLLRSRFHWVQLLQILVNVVFSVFIDIAMHLLWWLDPASILAELLFLIAGCAILAFGICIEVAPNVLMVPGEGIVNAIAWFGKWRFGSVKIAFDSTICVVACMLSFYFFGGLNGLGIGTIISAVLVGRFVNIFNKSLFFLNWIAALAYPRKS